MIGSSSIERPLARLLEEMLGDEAGPFAYRLREAALTSMSTATAMIKARFGDDGPLTGVQIFADDDILRAVIDLSDTVYWMMGVITARNTALSETAMMASREGRLDTVIAHRWLDAGMTARNIRRTGMTTIVDVGKDDMPLSMLKGWPEGL